MSTEEFFALYRGIAECSNDSGLGLKLGTEERLRALRPDKDRCDLGALIPGRSRADFPLQTTHLSRGNPRHRKRE